MAPADYGPQLQAVDWCLVVMSAVFLTLRLYCKIWRHRGLWWDDHTVIAAWVRLPPFSPAPCTDHRCRACPWPLS